MRLTSHERPELSITVPERLVTTLFGSPGNRPPGSGILTKGLRLKVVKVCNPDSVPVVIDGFKDSKPCVQKWDCRSVLPGQSRPDRRKRRKLVGRVNMLLRGLPEDSGKGGGGRRGHRSLRDEQRHATDQNCETTTATASRRHRRSVSLRPAAHAPTLALRSVKPHPVPAFGGRATAG